MVTRAILTLVLLVLPSLALAIPAEQLTNNCTDTLNGTIASGVTSLVVTTGTCFPTSGRFRILIDTELIIVDARSGTTLSSLTRGAEGTSAASHTSGATVTEFLTAGAMGALDRPEYNLCSGSGPNGGTYQCYEQVTSHVPEVTCYLTGYANQGAAQTCSFTAASAPGFASTSYIASNVAPIGAQLNGLNTLNLPASMSSTDGLTLTGAIIVKGQ